jgi:4-hydroxybenzoate polyprenyltransferase
MQSIAPRVRDRLLGLLLVTHPVPSAMYVVGVGLFSPLAAAAAHRSLAIPILGRVLIAVACAQIAIGATNDYRDLTADRLSRPEKPLVRGVIEPWHALALAAGATVVLLALMIPLGPLALILAVLIEGLGLAYDLGLKGTPLSALLYAVYFPLIPLLAWAVFGRYQPFLPWLLPLGAILGVAMNIANSLPDLEDDLAAGVRGLPHLLGFCNSLVAAWDLPVLAVVLMWALAITNTVSARPGWLAAAGAATLLSSGGAAVWYRRRPSRATLRKTFLLQALGVIVTAAAWLAAVAF